ncbi:NnrS family protein [Inquilinus limosus]
MTLAIMTRASLGHTGRALTASGSTQLLYPTAAMVFLSGAALPMISVAAVASIAAFGGSPRMDRCWWDCEVSPNSVERPNACARRTEFDRRRSHKPVPNSIFSQQRNSTAAMAVSGAPDHSAMAKT